MSSIKCHFLGSKLIVYKDQTPNCNMATWVTVLICLLFTVAHLVLLTEPSNVAFLKPVNATATCGSPSEQYFSISQRNEKPRDRNESTCNALDASNSHNASDLVDGKFLTWWQSPAAIDKVNITIDLHGRRGKVRNTTVLWSVKMSDLL